MRQTASGFRSYKDWRGVHSTDYVSSDFSDHGHGVTCTFQISANSENNFTFMKANIHKEGNSEGLNGTYAHQRIGINIEPEANIDRSGILSCIGFNIGEYYDQYSGYIDIAW